MANLIVKVTNGAEIRRFTATSDTLTWPHLSKRCAEMFDIPKTFKLTYVDDEGDRITLSTDAELDEAKAMAFLAAPPVLRLSVVMTPVVSESKGSSCDVSMSDASTEPEAKPTYADAGTHAKPSTADAGTNDGARATADAGTHMNMNNPMNNNHTNTTHNNTNPNIPRSAGSAGGDGYVTPSQVPAELSSLFHSLARELPALVSQLPESVRAFLPRAELDLAATLAATRAANSAAAEACHQAGQAAGHAAAAATAGNNATSTATSTSGGGFTSSTSTSTSSASAAQASAGNAGGGGGAAAATPDVPMPDGFWPTMLGCHPGVRCDRTGECPIRGNRYNLVGRNYDLCEAEYLKLPEADKSLYVKIPPATPPPVHTMDPNNANGNNGAANDPMAAGFHPGVECDRSGMCPIIGVRYNLKGHDYDLCQREFDKLSAAEKLMYTPIPPVCHRGNNRPGGHPHGRGFGRWGGPGPHGWGGPGPHGWGGPGPHGNRGPGPMCGGTGVGPHGHGNNARLAARFVRDVSIFDGTQMAPSTRFTKIWRLKNSGELPWPPGTRMLFVGGDQMTAEMSVPLSRATPVLPGEEVDVDVEMVAPSEHGRYLGYWRLMGPRGRKFGQRVWCHVQVVDPAAAPDVTEQSLADAAAELAQKKASLADADADADDADADMAEVVAADKAEMAEAFPKAMAATTTATTATTNSATTTPSAEAAMRAAAADRLVEAAIDAAVSSSAEDDARASAEAAAKAATLPIASASSLLPSSSSSAAAAAEEAAGASSASASSLPSAIAIPASAADGNDGADGNLSDSCLSDSVLVEKSEAADPSTAEGVAHALGAMGFTDHAMVEAALGKHGADLDACASDLAQATEWDSLLDDLAEMGFENRDLNKQLMLRHDGNLKRTVKALVEDA